MTRKKEQPKALDVHKALYILYGNKERDLTAEGYIRSMHELRQKDTAQARRVERILAPVFKEKLFRRRLIEWYETSEGTRVRLLLLPDNPHIQADIDTIRKVLGIPTDHIHATEEDPLWQQLKDSVRPEKIRHVAEGNLAGWWLHTHAKVALGQKVDEIDKEVLGAELLKSAMMSATKNLRSNFIPDWIRQPVNESISSFSQFAPIEYCASRLTERYNLPSHAARSLIFYILTQDSSWIRGIDPLSVDISYISEIRGHDRFNICLNGVDEFITKKDWEHVWIDYVKPRQRRFWEQRGMSPQGRRAVDIKRLERGLPLYRKMITNNMEIKELLLQFIEDLSQEDWDQEAIRATIHDLEKVLAPK